MAAGYSIVLNLAGNAVKHAETLATALGAANANAMSLAASLGAVGAAARGIPPTPIRVARVPGGVGASRGSSNGALAAHAAATSRGTTGTGRVRGSTFARFGTNYSFAGLSGGLNRIMMPDENGNILGMNSGTMMVTSIAGSMLKSAAQLAMKTVAFNTLSPVAMGGGLLMIGNRMLQSENFGRGVRLISRRRQAELSMGMANAEKANISADNLAASYGFDRSAALASINVLTGAGIGGNLNNRISMGQASTITKIGGFIAQQNGAPFEKVMTNLQQLLVQANPNIRDIRELLNQAPILGKYALKDMEARGVNGVDVRTYLKDQSNLLNTLYRYEVDNASNAGMRARGQMDLAMQDMWTQWAGNNKFWNFIGGSGASALGALGGGVNGLLTSIADSPTFQRLTQDMTATFENLGTFAERFFVKAIDFLDKWSKKLGIDLGDDEGTNDTVNRRNALRAYLENGSTRAGIRASWLTSAEAAAINDPALREGKFNMYYEQLMQKALWDSDVLSRYVTGVGSPVTGNAWFNEQGRARDYYNASNASGLDYSSGRGMWVQGVQDGRITQYKRSTQAGGGYGYSGLGEFLRLNKGGYPAYGVDIEGLRGYISRYDLANGATEKIDGVTPTAAATEAGSDLTGYNRDRRALEIHFHAPIVEWNNTMNASNPEETVNVIAENIEQVASAGLQKALLGASNKATSRWY